jgi:hypothetical protein
MFSVTREVIPVDLPNDAELSELLTLVEARYPKLGRPDGDARAADAYVAQFSRAIHFLCYARRADKLNTKYHATYWVDQCREFCRQQGLANALTMTLSPFTAAVVASGVLYSDLSRFLFDLAFGLSLGEVARGSDAWRDVIWKGQIPDPITPRNVVAPITRHLGVILTVTVKVFDDTWRR